MARKAVIAGALAALSALGGMACDEGAGGGDDTTDTPAGTDGGDTGGY